MIQNAYKQLWNWNDKKVGASGSFQNFVMKGWLRKRVNEVKFFQYESFPKRFFTCDFTKAILMIAHTETEKDKDKMKVIAYRDIIRVIPFSKEYEAKMKEVCHNKYCYGF